MCDTDLTYVLDRKWPLTYHTLRSLAIRDPSQCDGSLFLFADKNVPLSVLHIPCTGFVVRSFSVEIFFALDSDFFDLDMEVILSAAALALVTWTPGDM